MLVVVDDKNQIIFDRFLQLYENEWAHLTEATTNEEGLYTEYQETIKDFKTYLLFDQLNPFGFAVVNIEGVHEILDFFILPSYRRKLFGLKVIGELFESFPGDWQIHQPLEEEKVVKFWKRAVQTHTKGNFEEVSLYHKRWKKALKLTFSV